MADDSSSEIKTLIRRLDPKLGNHKDRIRAITKFRNYVAGTKRNQSTPEFYDDDIPLLFLGSAAPAAALDEDLVGSGIYGLMQACGSPSTEHDHMLKRSARHAMTLLKYLVVDFVEVQNGKPLTIPGAPGSADHQLNIFAQVFCTLTLQQYGMTNFALHVEGDQRGGAKDDACHVLVLLLTHHLAEDGETPAPLAVKDFLPYSRSQKEFELWLAQNVSRNVQQQIQRKSEQRQDDLKLQERQEQLATKELGRITEDDEDESENADDNFMLPSEDQEVDVLAGFKRRKKAMRQEMQQAKDAGDISDLKGPALTWEDSQLCREQKAREAAKRRGTTIIMEAHESVRDSQEAVAELLEREEEKAKVLGRDPLGMFGENFDLRTVQARQADFFEEAVRALEQEMRGDGGTTQHSTRYQAQKESLESIIDVCFAPPGEGGGPPKPLKSVLPTDPDYDPLLFLTLVHRNATYEELMGSISRLSNKTENQVQQLQKLVRDNFALFVRCADGVDVLNEHLGSKGSGPGVKERLDTLDAFAESCAYQAKKSFKPLLDNTSEVRKVQSTLAVLQRVAPILQAPYLMRHHVENGRFSQALKAYRRVLVIDEQCSIEILNHVREKAAEYAREARRELEGRLAQSKVPVQVLLDGIRDLGELLELDIPPDPNESERVAMNEKKKLSEEESGTARTTTSSTTGGDDVFSPSTLRAVGVYDIGGRVIRVRDHPPALACFLLQAAHFSALVAKTIGDVEHKVLRIFDHAQSVGGEEVDMKSVMSETKSVSTKSMAGNSTASGSQWKYDVLDDRVHATIKAVEIARTWLPRILRIGTAAREDERRRAARVGRRPKKISSNSSTASETIGVDQHLSAFEVFFTNIAPSVTLLVEHAAFCALGSTGRASAVPGKDLRMSFGMRATDKLRNLLRSPLPPSQSARVGKELAELVDIVTQASTGANGLQAEKDSAGFGYTLSPLDETKTLCEKAVITLEKRRCIYAFDVCSRTCASRASGSGTFDGEALLACLQSLSEQLTRPEQCSTEIVKGCELVVRRCCEGLASYVRDRGDIARLRAIAECADALNGSIPDVVREVAYLTSTPDVVEEVINEDIVGLEGAMFDEFLDSIRQNVVSCCRIGWLDFDPESAAKANNMDGSETSTFPAYLSASLLAIVRCRAQVERALGDKIRRAERVSYQHLAMATAAESVVRGICDEVKSNKSKMKVRQADRMANELHFLMNTLKSYLNDDAVEAIDSTRRMLCSKAGRGGGFQGDGPDGLAALEDLERLGRVYVLCLGE